MSDGPGPESHTVLIKTCHLVVPGAGKAILKSVWATLKAGCIDSNGPLKSQWVDSSGTCGILGLLLHDERSRNMASEKVHNR